MFGGTWVRKGCPFARKLDSCKFMDKGKLLLLSMRPIKFKGVEVFVMLGGAMVIDETELAYLLL